MKDDGSRHVPGPVPEDAAGPDVVDQPGWFARAGVRARRVWRWVRRKHEPISEGIETAGRGWTRAARTAARIGRSFARMGRVIEKNGAILARGRGRARRIGRSLVAFGAGLHRFGEWLTNTGRRWAPLGEDIEDIGEHLGELDIAPLPPEEPPEPRPPAEPPHSLPPPEATPEPVPHTPVPRPGKVRKKAVRKPPRTSRRKPARQTAPAAETNQELPAEVREAIAGLGKRPRSERLRDVIEMVCRSREWTTVREMSAFLGVSEKTIRSRHLPAMIEDGRLVRRFPDRPRHRNQAYGAARRD